MLEIGRDLLDEIVAHSRLVFPIEACGLMAGEAQEGALRRVGRVYRAKNVLNSSSRFQLDPEEQLSVFLEVEGGGHDIVGVYHSHPFWSAELSDTDRSMAHYNEFSYLVYSVRDSEFRSFSYHSGELVAEEIRVI